MITREDYFGQHDEVPEPGVEANAADLLACVNALLVACGFKTTCDSGWRPPKYNAELRRLWQTTGGKEGANTAVFSRHMDGNAIDLRDNADQQIAKYLLANPAVLIAHGLYMEHPSATRGRRTNWCHLQRIPPKSGNRVFYP